MEVIEHPVKICNPQDQNNDNQAVQDRFDLSLHGDEPVHNPQQKSCCNKCNEYSGKRHIVFSNRFLGSVPPGHPREVANDRLIWRGSHQKEENDYSTSLLFFQVNGEKAEP
jgi:hypothetical protein